MPPVTLPYALTNGSTADADQVMADLVALRDAINGALDSGNLAASAGIVETQLVAGAAGLAKGAFRAYRSSDVSIARNNAINFSSEDFDVSGAHSAGVYTAPEKGVYHFDWSIRFQPFSADTLVARLRVGGTPRLYGSNAVGDGSHRLVSFGAGLMSLAAGDQVTVDFDSLGGSGSAYTISGEESTMFGGHLVGRLP